MDKSHKDHVDEKEKHKRNIFCKIPFTQRTKMGKTKQYWLKLGWGSPWEGELQEEVRGGPSGGLQVFCVFRVHGCVHFGEMHRATHLCTLFVKKKTISKGFIPPPTTTFCTSYLQESRCFWPFAGKAGPQKLVVGNSFPVLGPCCRHQTWRHCSGAELGKEKQSSLCLTPSTFLHHACPVTCGGRRRLRQKDESAPWLVCKDTEWLSRGVTVTQGSTVSIPRDSQGFDLIFSSTFKSIFQRCLGGSVG